MIFISIACHDDIDVIPTCRSAIEQAARPDQLRIVVILQTDQLEKYDRLGGLSRVEVHHFPLSWATGVGKPRNYAVNLLQNEEFFLQIDSHVRFQPGWDHILLSELEECQDERGVISGLPPGFVIATEQLLSMKSFKPVPTKFIGSVPVFGFGDISEAEPPPKIPHLAACVVFCRASAIKEVPPDPYYHYYGEELSQSLRWWTRGYTLYGLRRCVLHHAWRGDNPRPTTDNVNDPMLHWRSLERIEGLLGRSSSSKKALLELEKYGLGDERTVSEWETAFGINLTERSIFGKDSVD